MADTFTPTLNLTKPEIDASAETWGQKLNADMDLIDAFAATMNTATTTGVRALIDLMMPYGTIILWAGSIAQIPVGWWLCNGTNSTPNLADRFVLGAHAGRAPGAAAGSFAAVTDAQGVHVHGGATKGTVLTEAMIAAHLHAGQTTSNGWHDHAMPLSAGQGPGDPGNSTYFTAMNPGARVEASGDHVHNFTTDLRGGNAAHTHDLWADGSHAHNVSIVPPYFALCYLMRNGLWPA